MKIPNLNSETARLPGKKEEIMTIDELIERSHAMAVEKGWYPDGPNRPVCEIVNLFHSEISEAWEEYRAGRMETWYASIPTPLNVAKPEGFWIEIADLCIRLADTMGAMGWKQRTAECLPTEFADIARFVSECHSLVETLLQATGRWHDQTGGWAMTLLRTCIQAADRHGVDLLALCELKMAYNSTRPQRHGGKLA